MDQPEHHDRLSIHPEAVQRYREGLLSMAERSFGVRGVEEVEALSDWEIVQRIESLRRGVLQLKVATQGFVRAMNGLTAQLGAFTEALGPALGQRLADEVELYLAIDHSE